MAPFGRRGAVETSTGLVVGWGSVSQRCSEAADDAQLFNVVAWEEPSPVQWVHLTLRYDSSSVPLLVD